ncbi:transglutaminase domain-containing protein [Paenalkalicoccus suaedae]|uniref:Transglutaminase domain-containing protein n=1 Tax=Paenalkalicoccus suaedae TaxID=2592382 RepID=A0A859FBR2_9BACI|nr:transglutaminase domain-containing protein [Paenalkalicoccus suaedae]QKS70400.1 transglutaminase domain-containing protein [Paenalkalicoccus suaedae]
MDRLKMTSQTTVTQLFIYLLTMLLLWEWLRPIPVISATGEIEIFVWFAFLSALLIFLRVPLFALLPILLGAMVYCIHLMFSFGSFFTREGAGDTIRMIISDVRINIEFIMSGQFALLTDLFRTILLLLLLGLIAYLLYFWVLRIRRAFLYIMSTIIYVTILDTFTIVNASSAIIRIVIIGFFLMTLLHMLRIQEEEIRIGKRGNAFLSAPWLYTLVGVIGIGVLVGVVAPKPGPQWSDPVPSLRGAVLGEGGGSGGGQTVRRVGYGDNDEQLGGGFIQDERVVFTAETDRANYWRGESKHEYTGRGWLSDSDYVESTLVYTENVDYPMFEDGAELEREQVSINMAEDSSFALLFYPGQLVDVDQETVQPSDLTFFTDINNGRLQAQQNGENVFFESYDLTYEDPSFPIETLRGSSGEDPEAIRDRYLQLPDDLPERVVELAEEITAEEDNRYDMALAVEQYFSQSGFTYQTTDVPIPEEGQDYVDQFLFETQVGYCDNYSTSMAVMLRALDIPTRWVKGFTAGEEIEELDDERYLYEVSSGNAHSWVEVYFPEVGWVPFEPTQGFENYADFEAEPVDIEVDTNDENQNEPEMPERPDMPDADGMDDLLDEGTDTNDAEAGAGGGGNGPSIGPLFTVKNVLISIPVLLFVMLMYNKQSLLISQFFIYRYRATKTDKSFAGAYKRLLWLLENEGLPKAEGETLREYAKRVDSVLSSQAMMKLTVQYEKLYYGGQPTEGQWEKLQKDWEQIVKSLQT